VRRLLSQHVGQVHEEDVRLQDGRRPDNPLHTNYHKERESPTFIPTSAPIHAAEHSQGEATDQGLGDEAGSGGEALPRRQS